MMTTTDLLTVFISTELLKGRTTTMLAPTDDLLLSGLLDSLSVLRLIGHIEAQLGVHIPPQDVTIEHFGSIQAIAEYLDTQHTV
jgi:acyl carrier protein